MHKKILIVTTLLLLSLALASVVQAKTTKYTFSAVINEQPVEIEASVKTTKKSDYSVCAYYAADYADYLGQYADDVVAGDTAEAVLDFCVDNFDDRVQ
ncbi:MAG: hypothetical protein R3300_00950 [Candidatus Promineifilaceae bacterium]|nr:hypothetical protein [Candidatus Promineifilaceae bacterium]